MIVKLIFAFLILFSVQGFSQNQGCVFLEGLGLPCFQKGVTCPTCEQQYSDSDMQNSCIGSLPLTGGSSECRDRTCGKKCCKKCSDFNPADYFTCQELPKACDDNGNPVSCGSGTKIPTCDDASCATASQNSCSAVSCTPCNIQCEGRGPKITCYQWEQQVNPVGTCGCTGASPGTCSGSPTGASECGGSPNPCVSSNQNSCTGASNRCWTCTYEPSQSTGNTPACYQINNVCHKNPTPVQVCATAEGLCPAGLSASATVAPGKICESTPPASQCSSANQCSCP